MEIDVARIVTMLKTRGSIHSGTTLFLGARAGCLYQNPVLYKFVKDVTIKPKMFEDDNIPDTEKFAECYEALKQFKEAEIYDVLLLALQEEDERIEDACIAEMVEDGYFNVVISSNFDGLLEGAFRQYMKEVRDFQVFEPGVDSVEELERRPPKLCVLLKVFGDLVARKYSTVGNEFDIDAESNKALKLYLDTALKRHVLMVGYDPAWDQPLEKVFPISNQTFWYVNEDPPKAGSLLDNVLRRRNGQYLQGPMGKARNFIMEMHFQLYGRRPREYETMDRITENLKLILKELRKINSGVTNLQSEISKLPKAPPSVDTEKE